MKLTSRMQSVVIAVTMLIAASAGQARNLENVSVASLLLTNGRIYTEAGTAEAVAIDKDGVIVAVGAANIVDRYKASVTTIIDLAGDTVLPGLHDMHVHPLIAGLQQDRCMFPQGSTLKQIQDTVAKCVKGSEEGEWITGGQWDASALGGPPNRRMLDKVAPNNPVLLFATSGHSSWANSLALKKAGITKDKSNPEGGIIERDGQGNPTGILRESAAWQILSLVPPPTCEENEAALEWALDKMFSYGITSLVDASVSREGAKTYAALADAGKLKQRVRLCLGWDPNDKNGDALISERNLYARDRLRPDCVKIFLDGVPTDSHTAAMLAPYEDTVEGRDDEASRKGLLLVSTEDLNSAVTKFDAQGLTVKFHAAGDAAVRQGLDAIAAARSANGFSGQLHSVGHCTFVAKSDIPRARLIGATYDVSPYLWAPSPINDSIIQAIGPERIKRAWPVRDMQDSGALVVPGSDWNVVPSVNPWIAIETLVTREVPGGGKSFGKGQGITLDEAFAMYTVNSAKQMGNADRTGRIEPGMLADLIVIDRNPREIPITELHKITVNKTIINGEVVYDRAGDK